MTAPDFSEHFGPVGEFIIGLIGLFLLSLMHKDLRRFAWRRVKAAGGVAGASHATLSRNSPFYSDWTRAFQFLFQSRRDLFLIVLALTAFDYLTGWYSSFILDRFGGVTVVNDSGVLGQLKAAVFSAPTMFTLLRNFGYTLFCWLTYRIASGASYQHAATFQPYRRLAGLFLCILGTGAITGTITPYFFLFLESVTSDAASMFVIAGWISVGTIFCIIGILLFTTQAKGAEVKTAVSALAGYLLLTQLLQWVYFLFERVKPSQTLWIRVAEHHASNFTYTLLWNIVLLAFAVRLSGPPAAQATSSHHAANAV